MTGPVDLTVVALAAALRIGDPVAAAQAALRQLGDTLHGMPRDSPYGAQLLIDWLKRYALLEQQGRERGLRRGDELNDAVAREMAAWIP